MKLFNNCLKGTVSMALAGVALSASIASADQLEDLIERGEVSVALAHEPPYTDYQGSGEVGGAAPTLLMRVMQDMGIQSINPQLMEFAALIPSLQASRADVISTGLYIKPDRCKAILFSEPDLCVSEGFAVAAGNPKNINSLSDIAENSEIVYGVCSGCSAEKRAVEMGIPRDRIITVPDHQSGIKMLTDGRVDVYAAPDLALRAAVTNTGLDNVDVVAAQGETIKCSGVGFRKGSETLRDAFDAGLAALKESGEYDEIVSAYGFNPALTRAVTREQLCAAGS